MLFFKHLDYEVVAKQAGEFTVRIKGQGGQIITIDEAVGEIILDIDNRQYNSDHRFYRHQDLFFPTKSDDPEVDPLNDIANRSSIEVTSTDSKEAILDQLIEREDAAQRSRLIDLLPKALATLTDKQHYAIQHYFLMGEQQKDIATQMHISPMMVHKHITAGEKRLRKFYEKYLTE